ncbi:MAG TPA: hypothetical protein VEK35_06835, partial [Roseiarcus sp.]|nr:hypothetical protein [Roseiarcus sp.]
MNKVAEILATMEYGPAPEANDHVRAWLKAHEGGFRHYIGGAFLPSKDGALFEVTNPADNSLLGRVAQGGRADVDAA